MFYQKTLFKIALSHKIPLLQKKEYSSIKMLNSKKCTLSKIPTTTKKNLVKFCKKNSKKKFKKMPKKISPKKNFKKNWRKATKIFTLPNRGRGRGSIYRRNGRYAPIHLHRQRDRQRDRLKIGRWREAIHPDAYLSGLSGVCWLVGLLWFSLVFWFRFFALHKKFFQFSKFFS